jgi:hypothetical protein
MPRSARVPAQAVPAAELAPRLRTALDLLRQARDYAQDLHLNVWDFAVELPVFHSSGVSTSDLRWLVCKGYIEHATETTRPGKEHREFRRSGQLSLAQQECFVVTASGVAAAYPTDDAFVRPTNGHGSADHANGVSSGDKPRWDQGSRELHFGHLLVKRFRVPAENQQLILASFEEEGWPPHIDDPLPPQYEIEPKKRLHDTINRLNGNQKQRLIQFRGNGDGRGVRWERVR